MIDTAFKRHVWKEFRLQWHVWVSLVIGAFVLQVLFLIFGRDFQQSFGEYPLEVAMVLTACYAVTSAAILFAGEREEQTDEWLRQLPITTSRLFSGKLTFTLTSLIAFMLVAFGTGLITKLIAPYATQGVSSTWGEHAIGFAQGTVGLLLWSVFYSLILSRVMAVLFAAVATQLVISGIAGNFLPKPYEGWMLAMGIIVAAADIWLAREWLSGRSVAPVFEGNRAATDRRSRLWLKGITWASARTPLGWRTAAVLLWRELRTASSFAIWWTMFGVLMVDVLVRWWGPGTNVVWILATPLVCGLMTCAGDNRQQTFRFLTNRGLNPLTIWLTKHIIWLPLAVGLVLVFGVYDVAAGSRFADRSGEAGSVLGILDQTPLTRDLSYLSSFHDEIVMKLISIAGSIVLLMYAIGHLCALWFRRIVVASSIAGLSGVLIFAWEVVVWTVDISVGYAVWPLVVATILASLATIGGWMLETPGWRHKLAQAAWIVVPIVGVMLAAMNYRATQIPRVALDFNVPVATSHLLNPDSRWSSRWRTVLGNVETQFASSSTNYSYLKQRWLLEDLGLPLPEKLPNENPVDAEGGGAEMGMGAGDFGAGMGGFAGMMAAGDDMEMMVSGGEPFDPWQDILTDTGTKATVGQLLALADDLKTSEPRIAPDVWDAQTRFWNERIHLIGKVIAVAAHQQAAVGDLGTAWHTLQSGLTLTEYLPTQFINPTDLQSCWNARETILREIQAWAAHPDQTVESIKTARQALASPLEGVVSIQPLRKNRYAYYRHLLDSFEAKSEPIDLNTNGQSIPSWLQSTEFERTKRLMAVVTLGYSPEVQQNAPPGSSDPQLTWPWVSYNMTPEHIQRWVATTPSFPDNFYADRTLDIQPVVSTSLATRVILDLHVHRLQHGSFPETLDDLDNDTDQNVVYRDSSTGRFFGYAPDGFPAPIIIFANNGTPADFIVPAGTPMLWSGGPNGVEIVRSPNGETFISTVGMQTRENYSQTPLHQQILHQQIGGRSVPMTWDVQPDDQNSVEDGTQAPKTNRILFVILGRRPW